MFQQVIVLQCFGIKIFQVHNKKCSLDKRGAAMFYRELHFSCLAKPYERFGY